MAKPKEYTIKREEAGIFTIISRDPKALGIEEYTVDIEGGMCTCKGWYYGKKRGKNGKKWCKHLEFIKGLKSMR